jgi:uncharacterized protein YbjQ (UPF0145 family)
MPEAGDVPAADDAKLVTLARSARARSGGAEGAAVRDTMGRTYVSGAVPLQSLRLTALQAAVAAAVASGADAVVAVAVAAEAPAVSDTDKELLAEVGATVALLVGPDGGVTEVPVGG